MSHEIHETHETARNKNSPAVHGSRSIDDRSTLAAYSLEIAVR